MKSVPHLPCNATYAIHFRHQKQKQNRHAKLAPVTFSPKLRFAATPLIAEVHLTQGKLEIICLIP